jgi:RNA polymerase sigma-70 factor (ECF subfamily)
MKRPSADAEIFEQMLRPHVISLYKTAYRLTGNREDAEDLVQDLLVKLYPKTREMQAVDYLGPWLKKSLYRQFIDGRRKWKRRPEHFIQDSGGEVDSMGANHADPEVFAQRAGDRRRLEKALDAIADESRSLVLMHLVEGYTLSEIAEISELSSQTLKTRLRRAKIRLKKLLQK